MTERWSAGIFRPLEHFIPVGARTMMIAGHELYFAACGSVTLQPGTPVSGHRDRCADCLFHEMRKELP